MFKKISKRILLGFFRTWAVLFIAVWGTARKEDVGDLQIATLAFIVFLIFGVVVFAWE